jgi:hypothetical protein
MKGARDFFIDDIEKNDLYAIVDMGEGNQY